MTKARLIHLATHGLLEDIRHFGIPGAVALAPDGEDDGFLSAGEIFDLDLKAELVILSACTTGLGQITGEGVVGLSRCLMAAGVPCLLLSLWEVDDLSTTCLMIKFHTILQNLFPLKPGYPASALKRAQQWLRNVKTYELWQWIQDNQILLDSTQKMVLRRLPGNSKPFGHPYYWAAFCAIGQ